MSNPTVSVVIPAYNQAPFVAEAIQSVVDQSYPHWELLIVDDGSTDPTAEVIHRFDDPRIRYIYQENKGLPGARNTGIDQASGELLAFLDADDAYHRDKLQLQVAYMEQHPEIGLGYTARVHVDQQGQPIWIYHSAERVDLHDLVLDFPFTINDLVVRRSLVDAIGGFDESYRLHGEDRDFYLRLGLNGCQFGGMQRALAYRRLHSRRIFKRIPERIEIMLRALETAFTDPRCPASVIALRALAYSKIYLYWAFQEFVQEETALAQDHLRQALQLNPGYLANGAEPLLNSLIWASTSSDDEHEETLSRVFAQLPAEVAPLQHQRNLAVAQAYLLKGTRKLIWGRLEQGQQDLRQAAQLGCVLDSTWANACADQISAYETEFGAEAADKVLANLTSALPAVKGAEELRKLRGKHAANRAFKLYRAGVYAAARVNMLAALYYTPQFITNRGVLAVLARSLLPVDLDRGGMTSPTVQH